MLNHLERYSAVMRRQWLFNRGDFSKNICRPFALILLLGFVCLQSFAMKVERPSPYQVYQRNKDDKADIPLEMGGLQCGVAEVVVKVMKTDQLVRDVKMARLSVSQGIAGGSLIELPTGGEYVFVITCVDSSGKILEQVEVSHILIGDLWVLAGQSNMEGSARMENLEPPSPFVHFFHFRDEWAIAKDPLSDPMQAVDPVHWRTKLTDDELPEPVKQLAEKYNYQLANLQTRKRPISEELRKTFKENGLDIQEFIESMRPTPDSVRSYRAYRTRGAGLGVAFGKELYKKTSVPVGLIFCANGGTSMDQWDPAMKRYGGESLYGSMIRRINAVGGKVKGVVWYQGESDAESDHLASYLGKTKKFIQILRDDLNTPHLPFLYVQIGRVFDRKRDYKIWNGIQHRQLELESLVDNVAMASAIDATMSDHIHLDAVSQRALGRQLAKLALILAYGDKQLKAGPRFLRCELVSPDRKSIRLIFSSVNNRLILRSDRLEFRIYNSDWKRQVVESMIVDEKIPDSILLNLREPLPKDATIEYGRGLNPLTGIVDDEGMSLPVFGPVDLSLKHHQIKF